MNDTPTPDNAARRYYMVRRAGSPDEWGNWFQPAPDDVTHYIGNPMYEVIELVSAATVTALEAESKEFQRMFYAMTDARNAEADRADAAERRVAELEQKAGALVQSMYTGDDSRGHFVALKRCLAGALVE